jgi:hypothetical protein
LAPATLAMGLFAVLGLTAFGGCGPSNHPEEVGDPDAVALFDSGMIQDVIQLDGDVCKEPGFHEGCSCANEGTQMECGSVLKKDGAYVTCSVGHATCEAGHWGKCSGDHFVVKSTGAQTLYGGTQPLYVAGPCSNVCDPNPNCTGLTGQVTDVIDGGADVGLYQAPDGGITLDPGDGGGNPGNCHGLQCNVVTCSSSANGTTISGTVYDPAGKNPMYNATVYIPVDETGTLPAFTQGATCDTCSGAAALNAVAVATTGPTGTFLMKNVPVGSNIPIVVQMGKWRREIVISSISPCADNTITPTNGNCTASDKSLCTLRLPRSQTDGYNPAYSGGSVSNYNHADLPQIAMISGSADPLECILMKAGISPTEISSPASDPTGAKRLHFMHSEKAPGAKLDPTYGTQQSSTAFWRDSSPTTKSPNHYAFYDVVLDACEGAALDKQSLTGTASPYGDLINYTNTGGRAFITHFGYVWLAYPSAKSYVGAPDNWGSVATWRHLTGTTMTQDPLRATILTSFPKGADFSVWLDTVGASVSTGSNQLDIHEGRDDLSAVGTSTQAWMTAHDNNYAGTAGNFPPHFTFNTPYGAPAANQCGRVVFSDFHVSANALVGGTNSCVDNSACGYGQHCVGGNPSATGECVEPCATNADCKDTTYSCCQSNTGACVPPTNGTCLAKTCIPGSYTCSNNTVPDATNTHCLCTRDSQCRSQKCVNQVVSGSNTCTAGNCTGNAAAGVDANGCQLDSFKPCTVGSVNTCSNSKFGCSASTGTCNINTTPGTVYQGTGSICTDTAKTCISGNTACTCTK